MTRTIGSEKPAGNPENIPQLGTLDKAKYDDFSGK